MLPSNVCRIGMPFCINYISLFSLEESDAFIDMLHVFVFSRVNVDLRWVRHRYVNVWWMPVAIYVHISFIIASLVMKHPRHYSDVTMCAMASQITSLTIGYRNWPRYGLRWSGLCCHSRHSTSGPAVARPLAAAPAGPRVLCREWQHKPRQCRPYEWSISILPRKRSKTQR